MILELMSKLASMISSTRSTSSVEGWVLSDLDIHDADADIGLLYVVQHEERNRGRSTPTRVWRGPDGWRVTTESNAPNEHLELPDRYAKAIMLLSMVEPGEYLKGVGRRVSETHYWVYEGDQSTILD